MCTFEGALKFYQKVEMDLVEIWTEPWNCTAARYTESGLLLLSIFDEGNHQLVLYNPNSFTKIKAYSSLYIKHAVTAIDLDETETEMALWSGKDLGVYKMRGGEKVSEFREKKEGLEASCVQYDSSRRSVLVGLKQKLVVCRKTDDYHITFNQQRHILIEEHVTCITLREQAQLAFLGTHDGKVLFCPYPFQPQQETLNDATVFRLSFRSVRVHCCPTADLLLTNNGKFLFASSKGEGLSILRIRKTGGMGQCYSPFDISNYNFIESSSKPYLESVQERLKGLLEKRKAIFNELD
jgi:hypothetical protein